MPKSFGISARARTTIPPTRMICSAISANTLSRTLRANACHKPLSASAESRRLRRDEFGLRAELVFQRRQGPRRACLRA